MNFNARIPAKLISAYGSHALRGNPVRDAPASRTAERFGLRSHAERGNDELIFWDVICDVEKTYQPFGKRYGRQLIRLSPGHLAARKLLALDDQSEYVVFIGLEKTAEPTHD
ncbi:hypothetical protein B0F88_108151 [Methylobacter tundripaludum]|uniref:Uncharacterized protein n=1 Tax=Methylobacter tundripaludum TaxID=173365 RepID=A0A2S6H043_9GAMM|nr:hypothetical protein [Methylobacter tundripaludum]PPK70796.1 hypothetical protein B0F88_108151 [Methylobacter tundripaludum]